MSTSNNIKPHKIAIETITPVAIGNNETLSPYTDFVFDGQDDLIHVVDKAKIANRIFEIDEKNGGTSNLMDEYVAKLRDAFDNNRSTFDLKNFLEKHSQLELSVADYKKKSIAHIGLSPKDRQEINCMVNDNDHPFIPGSSTKGAIKTALLYDWLSNTSSGKYEFGRLMKEVQSTFERVRKEVEQLERMSRKRRLSGYERKSIKDLKRQIQGNGRNDGKAKQLNKTFSRTFDQFMMRPHRALPMEFSRFKVSDTALFQTSDSIFQLTHRLHYNKGTVTIPAVLEAIAPAASSTFQVSILPEMLHNDLQFLNGEHPMENLFKKINDFHMFNIDMELEMLKHGAWSKYIGNKERQAFDNYQQFLEQQYNKIKNALPNEAYFCVGFGKSFFYNSIGLLVFDWKDDRPDDQYSLFDKYCKLFKLGRDGQYEFPLTRTVT
ncbi:MAG: type III-A CRISPR-associated RAMP protein Csm5, partial [Bacteroidota bacterium]